MRDDRITLMDTENTVIVKLMKRMHIIPSSTGMYHCTTFVDEEHTIIDGDGNYCVSCIFLDDVPYNYGDVVIPTLYDGGCDECGKSGEDFEPKILNLITHMLKSAEVKS